MSRQVNFFAAPEDAATFHSWLLATFSDMAVVFDVSARHQAAGGVPQPIAAELLGREPVDLVPAWAKDRLVYCPPGSMVSLNLFDSPVLEYRPSIVEADKECVEEGRIYWGFRGDLDRPEKKQIDAIFRWIKSNSELLPGSRAWRIFSHARRFRLLRYVVADPKPNPLFEGPKERRREQ